MIEPTMRAAAASEPAEPPIVHDDDWEEDDDDDWREDDSDEAEAWRGEGVRPEPPPGSARRRRFLDDETALSAARTLSALADLVEAIKKHRCDEHPDAQFASRLSGAFNGATKAVTETLGAEWTHEWIPQLTEHGREALATIVCGFRERGLLEQVGEGAFEPLDEAWLSQLDPERTPEAEQEAERTRRCPSGKRA